jgi:aspartate aminotransferase-like enzyme
MQEPSVSDPVFTLTSGPVDAYPAVLRALSRTVLYDYDPAFLACYERVNEKAREAIAAPTTTAVRVPHGIDDAALRAAVRARYGVAFSSGRGETLGKVACIGHMGPTARPLYAVMAVAALGGALASLGHPADVGAGAAAAMKVIDAAQ